MKKQTAVLLMGLLLGIAGVFLGAGKVRAQEAQPAFQVTPYAAYLSMKEDTQVYLLPGTSWEVLGSLKKGQPAISFGKTDTGWSQIYYMGAVGYVPGDVTEAYEKPAPTVWEEIPVLENLKINALGDSITYGDKLRDTSMAYPYLLAAGCGAQALNNYGWNGSSIGGMHPDRLLDRYPAMDRNANLILVFGGTNDYGGFQEAGTPIGNVDDLTPESFCGALNLLMCGLKQMYPDGEIVFITPLKRVGYMRRNRSGYYLNQYVDAMKERAAFHGIRVLDLFQEPELDFSSRQAIYLVDGLHPDEMGHRLISAGIRRELFGV